mgnify:CR=1 FL=1
MNQVTVTEIDLADVTILLNNDSVLASTNADSGIWVKRLHTDNTTRKDAKLWFIESTGRWSTVSPNSSATMTTHQVARVYTTTVGDGSATTYTITHNLNTRAVHVSLALTGSTYDGVVVDWKAATLDTITLTFAVAPTSAQYTVTVIG